VDGMALDIRDPVASVELLPDVREVEGGRFASLFAPQAVERLLVFAHYDPGVGAADEVTPIETMSRFGHLTISLLRVRSFQIGITIFVMNTDNRYHIPLSNDIRCPC
jgi:hypothetical protein